MQGVNQTKHQILIEASVKLSVLAPGSEVSIQVSSQVAVAEPVIVGTVPEGYFYMQGQNGWEQGHAEYDAGRAANERTGRNQPADGSADLSAPTNTMWRTRRN